MKKKTSAAPGGATINHPGGASSMGPLYKKRGYASSQLEMRRDLSYNNPKTAGQNNQMNLLKQSSNYDKA